MNTISGKPSDDTKVVERAKDRKTTKPKTVYMAKGTRGYLSGTQAGRRHLRIFLMMSK